MSEKLKYNKREKKVTKLKRKYEINTKIIKTKIQFYGFHAIVFCKNLSIDDHLLLKESGHILKEQ